MPRGAASSLPEPQDSPLLCTSLRTPLRVAGAVGGLPDAGRGPDPPLVAGGRWWGGLTLPEDVRFGDTCWEDEPRQAGRGGTLGDRRQPHLCPRALTWPRGSSSGPALG